MDVSRCNKQKLEMCLCGSACPLRHHCHEKDMPRMAHVSKDKGNMEQTAQPRSADIQLTYKHDTAGYLTLMSTQPIQSTLSSLPNLLLLLLSPSSTCPVTQPWSSPLIPGRSHVMSLQIPFVLPLSLILWQFSTFYLYCYYPLSSIFSIAAVFCQQVSLPLVWSFQ